MQMRWRNGRGTGIPMGADGGVIFLFPVAFRPAGRLEDAAAWLFTEQKGDNREQ